MKESAVQKKLVALLEGKGCYVVKVISASKAGVPDILGCYRGVFFGIEVKTPQTSTNVAPLQKHNIKLIKKAGGYAIVAWSIEQVEALLEVIDDNTFTKST